MSTANSIFTKSNRRIFSLALFVLALALTWLYDRTDNLLVPITAHALFNAANFAKALTGAA